MEDFTTLSNENKFAAVVAATFAAMHTSVTVDNEPVLGYGSDDSTIKFFMYNYLDDEMYEHVQNDSSFKWNLFAETIFNLYSAFNLYTDVTA